MWLFDRRVVGQFDLFLASLASEKLVKPHTCDELAFVKCSSIAKHLLSNHQVEQVASTRFERSAFSKFAFDCESLA